jgi:hypothetical protein
MKNITKGQQFQINRTTPFGKEISEILTVVAVVGNNVMMDNGRTFHDTQF